MSKKTGFELIDYIMRSKGLYEEAAGEENEPIGDGTPSDEASGELEPENSGEASEMELDESIFEEDIVSKKRLCKECASKGKGERNMDKRSTSKEVLESWFRLGEEEDVYNSETEVDGLDSEEAKSDNEKTDWELAGEGGGQSPSAEIKEAVKKLKRFARHLREDADEAEAKADDAEEKAEKEEDDEKKEKLEEISRRFHRKARRLREEAEEASVKADEIEASAEEDDDDKEDDDDDEKAEKAIDEWTKVVAITGRRLLKEEKKRRLARELAKLLEEEEVGAGTPSEETDLDDFGADDEGNEKREPAAAPSTEDELED